MRKALFVLPVLLLLMAASPRGVWEGGDAPTSGRGVSAPASRSAPLDTLIAVFAMTATPSYPASPSSYDLIFTDRLDSLIGIADAVYTLGTGADITSFAWGIINQGDTDGYYNSQYMPMQGTIRSAYENVPNSTTYYALTVTTGVSGNTRRAPMFYIPFEDYLPGNAGIVSATLYANSNGAAQWDYSDTTCAVLLDKVSDNKWYTVKGGTGLTNSPNYAHASWTYQIDTNAGGWSGSQSDAWSPTIANRTHYWDWGDYFDWSGSDRTIFAAGQTMRIDLTDCVQAAVRGVTNNGIILLNFDGDASTNSWTMLGWDPYSTAAGRQPYVVVKYVNKPYAAPYPNGADWAFIASTDDWQPANQVYADTFLAHGGTYTMFGAKVQMATNGRMGISDLVGLLDEGFEIGPHSRKHYTAGLLAHQPLVCDPSDTAWVSLLWDVDPSWMYDAAEALDGDRREANPYFAKSMAIPQNTWSPEVLLAIANTGYEAFRAGAMDGDFYTRELYWGKANQGAARTDSISSGAPTQAGRRARNLLGLPTTLPVQRVVGAKANATADLDSIRNAMRRIVSQVRAQDRGELVLFWHDNKTSPNDPAYSEGVDGDDLGAMLDVVDEYSGPYMRASERGRWLRQYSTAVPTPAGFAQVDTFRFTADDDVWGLPYGIDNRWMRNIRQ